MAITVEHHVISAEAAHRAVAAAVEKAEALGIKVNAAVVDAGGNLAAFLRMPGAFLHSITIAQDKAYSAAGFGMPTHELYRLISTSDALRESLLQRPRLAAIGGGLPIEADGRIVGGIGVSGASEEQDEACAAAGLMAIGVEI